MTPEQIKQATGLSDAELKKGYSLTELKIPANAGIFVKSCRGN
ncbi:Uncharacterised protein [Salmonella enterica subsp. arizonae]|uniref:Uncharacterized protein n=1 Tax=Salmonella enterica subsp. arizonae TaxID=59203 RepID=A0A379XIE5_SALER|nr:Uncharacterised protein [Salmonella enterica subsp. arizonae]